jgi:hypothetical protein
VRNEPNWGGPGTAREGFVNEQNQFAGLGHGRDAHATGEASAADAANVRNEPNSDGPRAQREGRVNEQSQFAGLGHGRDAHATGDGPLAGAANVRNEPNSDGPGTEREVSVNEQSQFGGLGHGRDAHATGRRAGEIPNIPLFHHSSISICCQRYKQSQFDDVGSWAGRPCYGGREEKRAFAVALPIPMPIIAAGHCTGGKHVSGLKVP